jgi:general secretion pathway protein D
MRSIVMMCFRHFVFYARGLMSKKKKYVLFFAFLCLFAFNLRLFCRSSLGELVSEEELSDVVAVDKSHSDYDSVDNIVDDSVFGKSHYGNDFDGLNYVEPLVNNVEPTEVDSGKAVYAVAWDEFVEPWKIFDNEGALLLNFSNADLMNLLKYFESEFKVTFITDDAISPVTQGGKTLVGSKINFISNNPLSRRDAWNVFVTLLEAAGVTLQPSSMARTYRVVSLSKDSPFGYTKGPLPLYVGVEPDRLPDTDMRIRYLYIVKNTSLKAVESIVKTMQSVAAPDPIEVSEVRGVLITDRVYNIKMIMTVIKELDQITTPEAMSILKLKKADAAKVVDLYKSLVKEESSISGMQPTRSIGPKRGDSITYFDPLVKMIPDLRTNTLILLGPSESIKRVESFIKNYEDASVRSPYMPTRRYALKYTQAEAVAKMLQQAIGFKSNSDAGKYGGGRGGERYLSNVTIVPEPTTNVIFITAPDEEYKLIYKILQDVDVEQPQANIDVIVMSIDLNKAKQFGTQIRNSEGKIGKNLNFQTGVLSPSTGVVTNYSVSQSDKSDSGVVRLLGNLLNLITGEGANAGSSIVTLGSDSYGIWGLIKMLQSQTEAKIISDPFIVATNNYEAIMNVGETRRIPDTKITNSSNLQQQSFTSDDAHIQVKITPQINDEDMITLNVHVENSQFTSPEGDSISSGNKVTRTVDTTVLVPDGEIVAIGGIAYESSSETQRSVPWFSKIPILGWLFKNKEASFSKSVIVVFIQPKIIKDYFMKEETQAVCSKLKGHMVKQSKNDYCPIHKHFFEDDSVLETYNASLSNFLNDVSEGGASSEKKRSGRVKGRRVSRRC